MSDHDAAPDPIDGAYARAEAALSDDAERAARRARVLAAVANSRAVVSTPPTPRPAWRRRGGWLVAASVAGLSVLVATQIYAPASIEPQTPPTAPAVPASRAPSLVSPPPPAASTHAPKPAPRAVAAAPQPATSAARDLAAVAPSSPPLQIAQASGSPPAAAPEMARSDSVSELVVTAGRIASAPARPRIEPAIGSPAELAARLRDAAATGRTAEVAALLAKGVPVDASDDDEETALMKSIQANHPAAAALLRGHGASLDRKNRAGDSARDMAALMADAELNRALGLDR